MIQIRQARHNDDDALARIDAATWTAEVSPAPPPPPGMQFFGPRTQPENVLVAEGVTVVGYAALRSTPLESHEHVLELAGLAVDPGHQRTGTGRQLVEAIVAEARARGARKLSLRVLGPNTAARQLYAKCRFVTEGVLREEFLLNGRYVDDILMARYLMEDGSAQL